MAKVYSDATGEVIAVRDSPKEEDILGDPVSFTEMLEFDPETNPGILENFAQDLPGHTLIGGVLALDGVPYTINPPTQLFSDRSDFNTIRDGLTAYYQLSSPTNAQSIAAIKGIIRLLNLIFNYWKIHLK